MDSSIHITRTGPWGIPASVRLGFVQLHTYGLILGLAGVLGWELAVRAAKRAGITQTQLAQYVIPVVFGGVMGARIWHVGTDWQLYADNLGAALHIWNGGLSIFGGIVGGIVVLLCVQRLHGKQKVAVKTLLDIGALSLPAAQAVGRAANFVNQELYGSPTQVPWALTIAPEYRVRGFEQYTNFHPLFAYEAGAVLIFMVMSWYLVHEKKVMIGNGVLAQAYLVFYAVLRLGLDFLRIGVDRLDWGLTTNQWVLVLCLAAWLSVRAGRKLLDTIQI